MLRFLASTTLIGAGIFSTATAAKPADWHPIEKTNQCVDDNSIKDAGRIVSWSQDFCPSDRRHGHPIRVTVNCAQNNYEKVGWKVTVVASGQTSTTRWPRHSPIIEWECFPGTGFM
jgi:hypothetical protein